MDNEHRVNIDVFQTVRKYSEDGGLLLYIRSGIIYKRRHDLETIRTFLLETV